MSYSILRVAKVKSSINITGIQKHVQRENKNYANQDIDHSRTNLNYDLIHQTNIDYNIEIEKAISERYKGKRKIRKDAVKLVDGIVTSDTDFFEGKSELEIRQFFEHSKEFLEEKFGKENLLYATVHLDEKTPHMHFGVVPLTKDGRLSANDIVGNKKSLSSLQTHFNTHLRVCSYDLDRGIQKSITGSRNRSMGVLKQETNYARRELDDLEQKISEKKAELEKVEQVINQKTEENEYIQKHNKDITERFEENRRVMQHSGLQMAVEYETERNSLFGEKEYTGRVILKERDYEKMKNFYERAKELSRENENYKRSTDLEYARKLQRENMELQSKVLENQRSMDLLRDSLAMSKRREEEERERKLKYKHALEAVTKAVNHLIPKFSKDIINHITNQDTKLGHFVNKVFAKFAGKNKNDFSL